MNTYYIVNDDELYHHGILGQKWGVRRFQNKDGTLTEAGRKHYGVSRYGDSPEGQAVYEEYKNSNNFSYKVGARRLNRRVDDRLDKNSLAKDAASISPSKQINLVTRVNEANSIESVLKNKNVVENVGKNTIKSRTIASIGAGLISTGSAMASAAIGSSIPLVAIPASTIALGAYWYETTK